MNHRKSRSTLVVAFVFLSSLLASQLALAHHDIPAWLTQNFAGPTYTVYYATACPPAEPGCNTDETVLPDDGDGDGTPNAVEEMLAYLEDSRSAFMSTFGMREPYFNYTSPRLAYMSGGCWGSYNGHTMWMCARGTSADWVQAKSTAVHELFHGAQWAYGGSAPQPGWVIEGQAAFIEDEVFNDLDDNAGTFLFSQGSVYLSDPNAFALTSTGYPIAWFWKYLAEQYGTTADPYQGMDLIETFWDRSDTLHISGMAAVDAALAIDHPGTTFEDVYKDFVIANYARKLTDPALPAKYRYADEAELLPGPLPAVKLDVDQGVGPTDQVGPLLSYVAAWGVRYYQIRPDAGVPIISIDVHQDTANRVFYTLLKVRDGNLISEERYTGRHFARSFPNDSYDQVVLIVAGLDNYANYRLGLNAREPVLNIVDPLRARPAEVTAGSPSIRDTFLVKLEVLDATLQSVAGIDTSGITLTVGTTVIPGADVLTSAYIQGQYWLLVRAPAKSTGTYDLGAQWSALSDTEPLAVNYTTRPTTDNLLVIDRSGSMSWFDKMTAAKNAGRLYIDSWPDADRMGLVSFNEDAILDEELGLLSLNRADAILKVNGLTAGGDTSIGDGAIAALSELVEPLRTNPDNRWAIVLISDGVETAPLNIPDFMNIYNMRRNATPPQKVPVIHTIALGADADRPKMQQLAQDTGGTFQFAAEPSALHSPEAPTVNLPLDLAEIYRVVAEAVDPQQQVFSQQLVWDKVHPILAEIYVDKAAAEAVFTLNWADGFFSGAAKLLDPNGAEVTIGRLDDVTHTVWRVPSPLDGAWHLQVDVSGNQAETYLIEAALKSPLGIDLYIDPKPEQRLRGLPVDLVVSLADQAPVKGAEVIVDITTPNGSVDNLFLFDDGLHNDGSPDDGLYGNRFARTFQDGSYIVRATATGLSNLGSPFIRRIQRSFDLAKGGLNDDGDQDGLPDAWEEAYGTDPDMPDSQGDPDLDGLPNAGEYQHGTDPQDADSDDGGENDGSEVESAKDPLDPGDDSAVPPADVDIQAGNGLNVILFPSLTGVNFWQIYASTQPTTGFSLLDGQVPPTGVYTHTGVKNGEPLWYKLIAVSGQGSLSVPSFPISATASTDPIAPAGSVLINAGAQSAHSLGVTLSLQSLDDPPPHSPWDRIPRPNLPGILQPQSVPWVRISNDPSFVGAQWELYNPTRSWLLDVGDGPALVYVQFKDDAGNLSEIISDAIEVDLKLWMPLLTR